MVELSDKKVYYLHMADFNSIVIATSFFFGFLNGT